MVRVAGEGAGVVEGDTQSGKPRLVDLDAGTVAVLRARKRERGAAAPQLARDDVLVFGDMEGGHRNPEHVSRQFARDVARCPAALGDGALPVIGFTTCATRMPRCCYSTASRCTSWPSGSATRAPS
jgi:hypothetical protein